MHNTINELFFLPHVAIKGVESQGSQQDSLGLLKLCVDWACNLFDKNCCLCT